MWFKTAVDAVFWAFMIWAFLIFLDIFGTIRLTEFTFSPLGFIVCYINAFVCVLSLRIGKNNN